MNRTAAGLAVMVAVLAGCGGTAAKTAQSTAPTTSTTAAGRTYDSPDQMLAVLTSGGFDCDDSADPQAAYDEYGALSLSCHHGTAQETIYLDAFPTPATEAKARAGITGPVFFGSGWDVTAQSPASLAQAQAILTAAS